MHTRHAARTLKGTMSHKIDKKKHKLRVRARLRGLKKRYMALTQDDSLAPEKALAVLKDAEELERAKRWGRRLARRGVTVQLAE